MPTRTATTSWHGTRDDGAGQVDLTSSGAASLAVSFPKRAAENADGTTSPEELIGAALSSCYAMQLSGLIGAAGATPVTLDVRADVTLRPAVGGGLQISLVALTVSGQVEGLDADGFAAVAESAKQTCPVSKALTGTEITLAVQTA